MPFTLVAEGLNVCATNLVVTHLFHSDLLHKAFGSHQSEQTDNSQPDEVVIQQNAGVQHSSSQSEQAASQSNTGVEQSSSQSEGAHNDPVVSDEQSSSKKEKYRLDQVYMNVDFLYT